MAFQFRAPASTATSAIRTAINNRPTSAPGSSSSSSSSNPLSLNRVNQELANRGLLSGTLGNIATAMGYGVQSGDTRFQVVGNPQSSQSGYRPGQSEQSPQITQPQQQKDDYGFNVGTQFDEVLAKKAENLRLTKENAVRSIETEISNLDPEYMKRQSQADTESIIAGQRLREQLAAEGQSGGENVTAMAQLQAARQNVMGGIGEEKAQRIRELKNKILDIQNAPDEGAVQLQLEKIRAIQDEARAKQAQDNWTQQFNRGAFESDREFEATQAARAAEQTQNKIINLWKESEELGYVPPKLAQLIGVKPGTQTMAAKKQAQDALNELEKLKIARGNLDVERGRLAVDRMNAATSRIRASQSGGDGGNRTNTGAERDKDTTSLYSYYEKYLPDDFQKRGKGIDEYLTYLQNPNVAPTIIKDIGQSRYDKLISWARAQVKAAGGDY